MTAAIRNDQRSWELNPLRISSTFAPMASCGGMPPVGAAPSRPPVAERLSGSDAAVAFADLGGRGGGELLGGSWTSTALLGRYRVHSRHARNAERRCEDALTMNASMGALPWLAHTQKDYAEMLLARDGPDGRERACVLLDAALATYRDLGMELYAAKTAALSQEADATAP